jgi:hypothetical protein
MTKRISLVATQVKFLDDELKYAPLKKFVYNSDNKVWYNVSLALEW